MFSIRMGDSKFVGIIQSSTKDESNRILYLCFKAQFSLLESDVLTKGCR